MYQRPFYKDLLLPAGNLREPGIAKKRADMIIVTKTPDTILPEDKHDMSKKLQASDHQPVFFSNIVYCDIIIGKYNKMILSDMDDFCQVT